MNALKKIFYTLIIAFLIWFIFSWAQVVCFNTTAPDRIPEWNALLFITRIF